MMSFKHSFKILMTKFSLVWSLLGYFVVATLIIGSIGVSVLIPFFEEFGALGLDSDFRHIFAVFFGGAATAEEGMLTVSDAYMNFYNKLVNEFFTIPKVDLSIKVFLLVVIGIVARVLFGLSELGMLKVLDGHMSANAQFGFSGAFISLTGKSVKYQLAKMLITLPIDIVIVAVLSVVTMLYNVPVMRVFLPLLIMVTLIILVGLRQVFMSAWGPAIATDGLSIKDAFGKGAGLVFRRKTFGKKLSVFCVVNTIVVAVNLFVTVFTLGAGLFITVPFSILWYNTVNMTMYYIDTGRRYYTDSDTIVTSPVNPI